MRFWTTASAMRTLASAGMSSASTWATLAAVITTVSIPCAATSSKIRCALSGVLVPSPSTCGGSPTAIVSNLVSV